MFENIPLPTNGCDKIKINLFGSVRFWYFLLLAHSNKMQQKIRFHFAYPHTWPCLHNLVRWFDKLIWAWPGSCRVQTLKSNSIRTRRIMENPLILPLLTKFSSTKYFVDNINVWRAYWSWIWSYFVKQLQVSHASNPVIDKSLTWSVSSLSCSHLPARSSVVEHRLSFSYRQLARISSCARHRHLVVCNPHRRPLCTALSVAREPGGEGGFYI